MMAWTLMLSLWLRAPHPCVHDLGEPSPRLTRIEQARTSRLIDFMARRMGAGNDFRQLLHLVAARESSYQAGLVHQLPQDLQASLAAYKHTRHFYEGNAFAGRADLWQTYGLFGMNSNYFTMVWSKAADPRVLCDAVVDVLVYRRSAARMLRKVSGQTIVCKDEKGNPYNYTTKATWETVHRAVSGGKLCPSKHEESAAMMRKFFRGRAARVGLDPDKPVTAKMLGAEPAGEWDSQMEMVGVLWAEFEQQERRGRT